MASVGEVVGRNFQSLEEVDLGWNADVGDEGLRRLGDGLLRVRRLKRLRLWGLELTHRSGRLLADVIGRQSALVECNLAGNNIGDSLFIEAVGPALQKCEQVEDLNLYGVGLTSISMELLAATLVSLPRLLVLHVGWNDISNEGFKQLAPGLQRCPQLRSLCLRECGLRNDDGELMPLLALVLLSLPQLERFSLDNNQIGDAGLEQLFVGLGECHRLTHLWLNNVGMSSSQSTLLVSRLLQQFDKLQLLNVSRNPFHRSATLDKRLCVTVEGHPSLEELYLPEGMSPDVINCLIRFKNDPACVLRRVDFF